MMRKLYTIVAAILLITSFQFRARASRPQSAAGNSSGGGGVSINDPVVTSVALLPPKDIKACLRRDRRGHHFVSVTWRPIPLGRVIGYDVYSCTDSGFPWMQKSFETWRDQVASWRDAIRAGAVNPVYPSMPGELAHARIGTVASSDMIRPAEDPENVHFEFAAPIPSNPAGKFCVVARDYYKFIDQISKPVAVGKCEAAPETRADFPAPENVKACSYINDLNIAGPGTYDDEIDLTWGVVKDPAIVGYKVYTCEDADFKDGEPPLATLKRNWVNTRNTQMDTLTSPNLKTENDLMTGKAGDHTILKKNYCIAAYDVDGRVGHVSKPVAPQRCY